MLDVVIIGGGPAGITAGTILQKKGYKTCIIDSQVFPREKLCAGVLTIKTIKLLQQIYNELDFKKLNIYQIRKVTLLYNQNVIGKYIIKYPYSVVNRRVFDNELLEYYKKMGGRVLEGQKGYKIIYEKNNIRLTNGKDIKYRYLIGADGINSKVRSHVQKAWKASVLCFEAFIPNELKEDSIQIDFGGRMGGYSWRIPGEERIGVGLGEFYIKGMRRMPWKYKKFFERQGVEELNNIRGAFVSFGHYVRKPVKNNVLLVGDAAGLVDAMTGEGIYFAIESGLQAAQAIVDHYVEKKPLSNYVIKIKGIHRRMREQSMYNKLLYVPVIQKISIRYIKKNPAFVQSVLNNVISTYSTGYTQEICKK